jgi:ABC-type antimicrobial peptide transport system permease subunit
VIGIYVLRSIARNVKNSLIILLLIAVISFLFFLGNSVVGRADRELRGAYVDSLTADIVIQKKTGTSMNLFGANVPVIDNRFTIPVLSAYDEVTRIVQDEAGVEGFTSQVSVNAFLTTGEHYNRPVLAVGVEAKTYFELFPGIILDQGGIIEEGKSGVMIPRERAAAIEKENGAAPKIGDPLTFTSGGKIGFKIRALPLLGIFHYRNPGQFMNEIVLMDSQTARVLSSIQVATSDADASDEAVGLLDSAANPDDIDSLFGLSDGGSGAESGEEGFTAADLQAFFSSERAPDGEQVDETRGDWNFILIRAAKGRSVYALLASLNKKLAAYGAAAVTWREAAGQSAIMLLLLQSLFNAGVFLVSVAGILVVVNILLIAVFRRTREIGTLRAIGAGDSYIRVMILSENISLSAAAGFAGIGAGSWLFGVLNRMSIAIRNDLLANLLGGPVLVLEFMPTVALATLAVAVVLGAAASIVPVEKAVRIDPVTAVRQG